MDSEGKYKEAHGNYKPTIKDKDGKDVVTPYEKLDENQKKMLSSKNVEAKIGISATFFRREEKKFVRQPYDDKRNFRKIKEDKKEDRRCFKCGDPNHFISDCPKNSSGDQKAFVVGSWSDSGDDSKKEEICLMAHSNEVLSDNLYYSSSSLDNESRQNEYDKLGQISLRIINKNKHLKAKNESLKKTINELKTKIDILEKGKETSSNCDACNELRLEVNSLKLKLASFENSSSSLQKMVEMQKPSKDKCGLGYTETIASPRNTKIKNLGGHLKKLSVEPAGRCHSSTAPACSIEQHRVSDDSAEKEKDLETNVVKQNDSVLITKKSILGAPKGNKLPPILKLGQGHGKSKIQTPPKTTHRRPSSLYPKSDYRQVGWNYGTQHEQQFQPPMYNQWSPFPPFPYMGQPNVTTAPLEATHADFFSDETEIDMSNITTTYLVPSTPNTRIHKDHSLDHVIGDVQTMRMTKTTNEQGFISTVYKGKTHEDLHTCLFAWFPITEDPKMLQQYVWSMGGFTTEVKDHCTKWMYRKKKDIRGIVIRNKARLVAQGYTQEEGIDYDDVFAPFSRIEAIRLFIAYSSFKDFVVYQEDVKEAFLYGKD
ncbi:zf-CCHC domain-containing protein [Tanacetum coccineum]